MGETTERMREGLAAELYHTAGPDSEEPNPGEWRRDEPRRLVHQAVEIRCQGSQMHGQARNAGPDSMCVVTRHRLQCGNIAYVRLAYTDGAMWSRMTVVHCTDTVGGHKVGLKSVDR